MLNVTPPIVIDGDSDFDVYSTVAEACSSLEPDDLKGGAFQAFDSVGHSLRMFADGHFVRMEVQSDSVPDPEDLARRARSYICEVGTDLIGIADPERASLPTMLTALQMFQLAGPAHKRPGLWSRLRTWFSSR